MELKIYQVEWSTSKNVDHYIQRIRGVETKLADQRKWMREDWLKDQPRDFIVQACRAAAVRLDSGAEDLEKRHPAELKAMRALKLP